MTIYYNPAYSATPYRKREKGVDVGIICRMLVPIFIKNNFLLEWKP